MEGFVGGGSFGEGKEDGGWYGGVLEWWSNKWRWRTRKMVVRICGSCSCCGCGEDEGEVSGD